MILFNSISLGSFFPVALPVSNYAAYGSLLAPFWSDIDLSRGGNVWARETTDNSALLRNLSTIGKLVKSPNIILSYSSQKNFAQEVVEVAKICADEYFCSVMLTQ